MSLDLRYLRKHSRLPIVEADGGLDLSHDDVELVPRENVNNAAMVPRLGPWAARRWASPIVAVLLVLITIGVHLGNSMVLIGAPRAGILGAAGRSAAVAVEVGSFAKATGMGNQDITIATDGTGFASGTWAVIFWAGTGATSGTWAGHALGSLGFAANGGGSISQFAASAASKDATGTPNSTSRVAAACISLTDVTPSNADTATFVAFQTSTTMRINWSSQAAGWGAIQVNYMIISGLTGAKVVDHTFTNGTGNKSYTGAGFQPSLVMMTSGMATGSLPQSKAEADFFVGVANSAGEQWSNSFSSQNFGGAANSNTTRFQRTDSCIAFASAGEVVGVRSTWVSMDSDGITMNDAVNTGWNGYHFIALYMKGVSSKIGSWTSGTSPQTVTHSFGQTVKGGLFSNTIGAASSVANVHASWGLGGFDGTNHRSAALFDQDNLATANADSVWYNTKSLVAAYTGPSSYDVGTMAFTSTTTMIATWSTLGGGVENLYLLIG